MQYTTTLVHLDRGVAAFLLPEWDACPGITRHGDGCCAPRQAILADGYCFWHSPARAYDRELLRAKYRERWAVIRAWEAAEAAREAAMPADFPDHSTVPRRRRRRRRGMQATHQAREGGRFAPPDEATIDEAGRRCYWDEQNDEEIARGLGVSRRTLARWKHHPAFIAARAKAAAEHDAALKAEARARARLVIAELAAIPTRTRRRRR
jgi:hypothetical protein